MFLTVGSRLIWSLVQIIFSRNNNSNQNTKCRYSDLAILGGGDRNSSESASSVYSKAWWEVRGWVYCYPGLQDIVM